MKYKSLGNTNIKIGSIGLGTNFYPYRSDNHQKLIHLMQKALDLGLNFFDTAEVYHNGDSEKLIGKAFKKNRDKVVIATKFSPENAEYGKVLKSAEGSLKRLQSHYIDLYQIHWPNPIVPFEETLKALEKLVKDGKVKQIGVSNFSLRQLKDAQRVTKLPIVSLQAEYNLLERSIEYNLLPYCENNKITTIAYTPLNSGSILKKQKYLKLFSNLSKKYNKTASQIILNFLTSKSSVVAIPSTTSVTHLQENAKSSDFSLEKKDIQIISDAFITKIIAIDTSKIKVADINDHFAYKTIEEVKENRHNFFPSPVMLAEDLKRGDFLKAVRVKALKKKEGDFEYELVGGRIRYWAYVLAYNGKKPIPVIIED